MAKRVVRSLGKTFQNQGQIVNEINRDRYVLDPKRTYIIFDIIPFGAVRMTRSDRWRLDPNHIDPRKRQRGAVSRYFAFKTELQIQAKQLNYEVGDNLDLVFLIPMPNSWSNKKKNKMNGLPCLSKPDTDNLTKAFKDALLKNDSEVWLERAEKRWAFKGSIIVFK